MGGVGVGGFPWIALADVDSLVSCRLLSSPHCLWGRQTGLPESVRGVISDHFGCSHLINLNMCWLQVGTHAPHTPTGSWWAPPTAFRNPDKNNAALGNLGVHEWGGCRAPTASRAFQLQPRDLPRSCDTATAAHSCSWSAKKKNWSNNIYCCVHLAYAPHSEQLIYRLLLEPWALGIIVFFPRWQAKAVLCQVLGESLKPGARFLSECLWSQPAVSCGKAHPWVKTSADMGSITSGKRYPKAWGHVLHLLAPWESLSC